MSRLRSGLLCVVLLTGARPALGQDAGERERSARARFEDGQRAYAAGDFPRAAEAFRRAYDLHASPELAFDVARVSERAGDLDVAIRYYDLYARTAHLAEEDAARVAAVLARLRAEQERRRTVIHVRATSVELDREARTFFERGVRRFRARDYRAALAAFEAAYSLARSASGPVPELFYNIAVTQERLAAATRETCPRIDLRWRAADTYDTFRTTVRTLGDRELAELRAKIEALRAEPRCR